LSPDDLESALQANTQFVLELYDSDSRVANIIGRREVNPLATKGKKRQRYGERIRQTSGVESQRQYLVDWEPSFVALEHLPHFQALGYTPKVTSICEGAASPLPPSLTHLTPVKVEWEPTWETAATLDAHPEHQVMREDYDLHLARHSSTKPTAPPKDDHLPALTRQGIPPTSSWQTHAFMN